MPTAVVLSSNIYDHNKRKRLRGEQFEAPRDWCDTVLKADGPARITVVEPAKKKTGAKDEAK